MKKTQKHPSIKQKNKGKREFEIYEIQIEFGKMLIFLRKFFLFLKFDR